MASRKNKKPDQAIYRPPKFDNSGKSHERTFYNSNHRKKENIIDKDEKVKQPETSRELKLKYLYEGDVGGNYYNNYGYQKYDAYQPRYGKYQDKYEYDRYAEKRHDTYYDDNSYYHYPNYPSEYRQYKTFDYNSYNKSQFKYKSHQSYTFDRIQKSPEEKSRPKNSQSTSSNVQKKSQAELPLKVKKEQKKQQYEGVNSDHKKIIYEYNNPNSRCRHNSYNKDFTDIRLFNPYKNEAVENTTPLVGGSNCSGTGRGSKPPSNQPNQLQLESRDSKANDTSEIDSHIHGGLIHLPENLEIKKTGGVTQVISPALMTTSTDMAAAVGGLIYTKSFDQKPTVMVRPTFSQQHATCHSNSMPYPAVSMVHGIQTISGFIPVQPTFISQGTSNLIRSPPQTLSTPYIMSQLRFTSNQMIHTPDESAAYSISNIVSKVPAVNQCMNQIQSLEVQLDDLIRSTCDKSSSDWWQSVNKIRSELMDLYRTVIIHDLDYCNQMGIEQNLWKSVFYSIMELIRFCLNNPDITTSTVTAASVNTTCSSSLSTTAAITTKTRHNSSKCENSSKSKPAIVTQGQNILKSGEEYFINLFTEISKLNNVDLEAIFDSRRPPPETGSRTRKLVYLSAQKLLLFLGDLARYSEMINNTCDFSKARIWYLKAQLLVPKNGRPYNQLAVISIYANRHLDALYYYTRTLAASNPFPTASQSLSFLFEETRKGDELIRRQQESMKRKKKKQNPTTENRKKGSIEIWIHPDDGTKEKKVIDDDDADILAAFESNDDPKQKVERQIKEDYISMPLIELHKLFTLSFLNSHGKLFGKINMENFPEVCSSMFQEFWALLSHQPCPLSSYRLCTLLIINMYIMDRVSQQIPNVNTFALRSLHQDHASRMTLDFFALLCQRAIEIFHEWTENEVISISGPLQLPSDLSLLLPPLCLWTDWMVTHPEYWNPLPSHRDPLLLPSVDDFGLISELCTQVSRLVERGATAISRPRYRILSDYKEADKAISNKKTFVLVEESLISGFLPMLDQIPKIYLLEDDRWTKQQTEDWIHLEKISLFGDFLCGINPPLLDYNVDTSTYVPTVIKEGSERQQDGIEKNDTIEHDIVIEDNDDVDETFEDLHLKLKKEIEEINFTHGNMADVSNEKTSWADLTEQAEEEEREHQRRIAQLKIKRANLKFREEKNRRFEHWRQSLLDHEIAQRFVELEIRPLFLVLDTNCYIDYLPNIQLLISHRKFIIVVPLIVVNELENLSKTYQLKDDVDIHARAKEALRFLEDRFEKGDQYVRAITSRGTFMETIAFRAEALNWTEGETNDDVILNCCQVLCKDKPSDFMPREKDKPITLHRDVVLLTGDRNLRIKALSRHIPVKPLKKFMEWADIRKRRYSKK